MKLGDVLDETRTPEPGPPKGRWLRRGFWLVTLGLWVALLVRHGPGVGKVEAGQVAVVYNLTGAELLGKKPRVVSESGVFFYVPLLHQVERIRVARRDVRVAQHLARTRDGVAIEVAGVGLHYKLRATDAPKWIAAAGTKPGAQDGFAESAVRAALTEVLRHHPLAALTAEDSAARVKTELEREVARRLAAVGVEVVQLSDPQWSVAGPLRVALAETRAAEGRTANLLEQARAEASKAARRRHEVDTRRQTGHFELRQTLFKEMDQARSAAAEMRRAAERYAILREAEGQAVKAELEVHAKSDAAIGKMQAQGIQARVQALSEDPSGLLDQTIATEVIPKLQTPRPGRPLTNLPPPAGRPQTSLPQVAPPAPEAKPDPATIGPPPADPDVRPEATDP